VNLSKDPGQDYFGDGLTEEIINALTPTPGLKVVARTSAFGFKGKNLDIRTVGEQLGADAVMEGSIRIDGDHLRVTAQLNSARDGYHYWSRTWDHQMKDVLAVQNDIAREVAQAMGRSTPAPPQALTQNLEAYDLYLRGMYHSLQTGQFPQAKESFEGALKLDPEFAAAHVQLASAYITHATLGALPVRDAQPIVRQHLGRALELNPGLAMTHAASAMTSFVMEWDFPAADREYHRALELNPADPSVHHDYSRFLTAMGRFEEAMEHARQAVSLDPLNLKMLFNIVWQHYYHGEYRAGIAAAQTALNVAPNHAVTHVFLELCYTELGDLRKASAEMAKHPFRPGVSPKALAGFERGGEKGFWQVMYNESLAAPGDKLAQDSAQLGLTDVSLAWIEKSIARRDPLITYLAVDPPFQDMRSDPRFRELVRRIGIPLSAFRGEK
jgi:TolB-like protein